MTDLFKTKNQTTLPPPHIWQNTLYRTCGTLSLDWSDHSRPGWMGCGFLGKHQWQCPSVLKGHLQNHS